MRKIIAIDIIDGKCVRLSKGDYSTKKIYNENPIEIAKHLENNGIKYVHLVDLDGVKQGKIIHTEILEKIKNKTNLIVDFGGGIRSTKDIQTAFDAGASQITGGSIAIEQPELFLEWLETFGTDKIVLGADCYNRKILTDGWLKDTSINILSFIKNYKCKGIRNVICTDISKDGMLQGPSFELYKEIKQTADMNLIASGGISSFEDLKKLQQIGCEGAIIGKAYYEGLISLKQIVELC